MKKKLFYLLALISSVLILNSCEENKESTTATYEFSTELKTLTGTYNDTDLTVGVVAMSIESNVAKIILKNIIPGQTEVIFPEVKTVGTLVDFTFEGELIENEKTITINGSIKDGVCNIIANQDESTFTFSALSENLIMNYGGAPLLAGAVSMVVDIDADITLINTLPGQASVVLSDIAIVRNATGFTFKGEETVNTDKIAIEGSVVDGICTIGVDVVYGKKDLAGKWYFYASADRETILPFNIEWVTEKTEINLFPGVPITFAEFLDMVNPLVSGLLLMNSEYITFREDGNLLANIMTPAVEEDGDPVQNDELTPVNALRYAYDDASGIRLFIDPVAFMAMSKSETLDLGEILGQILTEGVPLTYAKGEDNMLKLTIPTEFILPLVKIVLPMLKEMLPTLLPPDMAEIAPIIESVLGDAVLALETTTVFNIHLTLSSVVPPTPEAALAHSAEMTLLKERFSFLTK